MQYRNIDLSLPPTSRRKSTWGNGDANKLTPQDRSAHSWYRFVLSYPPHLVRDYLERLNIEAQQTVLDPFCGTGTTLVECKKLGIPSMGIEMHPMSHFASSVKVDWSPDPDDLIDHALMIADKTAQRLSADGIEDSYSFLLRESNTAPYGEYLRTLDAEKTKLLLTNSISPLPLHKALVLLEILTSARESQFWTGGWRRTDKNRCPGVGPLVGQYLRNSRRHSIAT